MEDVLTTEEQNLKELRELLKKMKTKKANVLPIALRLSADTVTPVSAYLRLQKAQVPAFLLDSVEGGEKLARYSFLGIDPFAILKIKNGRALLIEKNEEKELEGHPFEAIQKYLDQYKALHRKGFPPFCGGAVGYMSYEAIRYFEDIPIPENGLDISDGELMLFRDVIAFDRLRDQAVVITNLFLHEGDFENEFASAKERAYSLAEKILNDPLAEERPRLDPGTEEVPACDFAGSSSQEEFEENVRKIKGHIRAGDIFQCVISERFTTELKAPSFQVYRALRSLNPSPYMFYLQLPSMVLLGASPERLIKIQDGHMETHPIAGTRPRGLTEAEDKKLENQLMASVKEKAEHLMLVDLGRNDIGRVAKPGTVKVDDFMSVRRFSRVMHITSTVTGQLKKSISPWQALASCFPAGTLSGAPKIRAMEIISELENLKRGPYGGAVVYYDFSGQLDSCITIRSVVIKDQKAHIQAGAGVVADSSPRKEYEEVLHKSRAVKEAVSLAHHWAQKKNNKEDKS